MDYTPEQLEEKFNTLPENVRETLTSVDVENRLLAIGRARKLHVDILGELADETGLVMLGLTHPREYVANLTTRLSVSRDEASAIARDVNEQIFSPIREALKRVHGLAGGAASEERTQGEIGSAEGHGRVGDGDIASLEERRERLILGQRASAFSSIPERKLAEPVRTPPERIDLVATRSDPYREPIDDRANRQGR